MDALLAAVVRGDATCWPSAADDPARRFLEAAGRHGVLPLVARQLRRGILSNAPAAVQQTLMRCAVRQAAVEQRLAAEIRRVVDALADAGVPSLLMKGAALAYTHYPYPCLRPRADTDLIVQRGDVPTVSRVLEKLKYEALNVTPGDLVLHQRSYARTDRLGIRHLYDVHWKLAAPKIVSDLVTWDELRGCALPVPALGDRARAIGHAHALLLACVHRIAHHYDSDSLIWLYDIHLLASRLESACGPREAPEGSAGRARAADPSASSGSPRAASRGERARAGVGPRELKRSELRDFMRLAAAEPAASMCARSLSRARDQFGTPLSADLASLVESASSRTLAASGSSRTPRRADDDAASRFDRRTRMVDVLFSDLKALPGWRRRLRLLQQHLAPPADYMRRRYGASHSLLLPVLYVHRCVSGAWKWLQPLADYPPSD